MRLIQMIFVKVIYASCSETLAKIYEKFGNRLLEKNVRVFLQARKKSVNDGIKTTIENEPGMFFAITTDLQQLPAI